MCSFCGVPHWESFLGQKPTTQYSQVLATLLTFRIVCFEVTVENAESLGQKPTGPTTCLKVDLTSTSALVASTSYAEEASTSTPNDSTAKTYHIEASIVRLGAGGVLYYIRCRNPRDSIGNHSGSTILRQNGLGLERIFCSGVRA